MSKRISGTVYSNDAAYLQIVFPPLDSRIFLISVVNKRRVTSACAYVNGA